jgi:hypothetical protein
LSQRKKAGPLQKQLRPARSLGIPKCHDGPILHVH